MFVDVLTPVSVERDSVAQQLDYVNLAVAMEFPMQVKLAQTVLKTLLVGLAFVVT